MFFCDICTRVIADATAPKKKKKKKMTSATLCAQGMQWHGIMHAGYIIALCLTLRANVEFDRDVIGWGIKRFGAPDDNLLVGMTTSALSALEELSWSDSTCILYVITPTSPCFILVITPLEIKVDTPQDIWISMFNLIFLCIHNQWFRRSSMKHDIFICTHFLQLKS